MKNISLEILSCGPFVQVQASSVLKLSQWCELLQEFSPSQIREFLSPKQDSDKIELPNKNLYLTLCRLSSKGILRFEKQTLYPDFNDNWAIEAFINSQKKISLKFIRANEIIHQEQIKAWFWGRDSAFFLPPFIHKIPDLLDRHTYQKICGASENHISKWQKNPQEFLEDFDIPLYLSQEQSPTKEKEEFHTSLILTDLYTLRARLCFHYKEGIVNYGERDCFAPWRNLKQEQSYAQDLLDLDFTFDPLHNLFAIPPSSAESLQLLAELGWDIRDNKDRKFYWLTELEHHGQELKLQSIRCTICDGSQSTHIPIDHNNDSQNNMLYGQNLFSQNALFPIGKDKLLFVSDPKLKAKLQALQLSLKQAKDKSKPSMAVRIQLHQSQLIRAPELEELDKISALQTSASCDALALPHFQGELRPYQKTAVSWMSSLFKQKWGGLLADEMGLGKTVVSCALISDLLSQGSVLLVVPASLISQWKHQLHRWVQGVYTIVYHGAQRQEQLKNLSEKAVWITSYQTLEKDQEDLKAIDWQCIILDEAQFIKNPNTQLAQACHQLNSPYKLALSATPIENKLSDIWSIFQFLNPNWLGPFSSFDRKSQDPELSPPLKKALSPFYLRRYKKDVEPYLPEKIISEKLLDFTPEQKAIYEQVLDTLRQDRKVNPLTAILRLRQLCLSPSLVDPAFSSYLCAKEQFLQEHVHRALSQQQSILIFSQFSQFLHRLREKIFPDIHDQILLLDGKSSSLQRQKSLAQFSQSPRPHIFLMSLQAAGVGLDLSRADQVILTDPWWNQAKEDQAIDRAHRIGRKGDVLAYRLIMANSIEEKIMTLKAQKEKWTALLNQEENPEYQGWTELWNILES